MNKHEFTIHNRVRLVKSGHEYFDLLLTSIDKAEKDIYLHTYILNDDYTGGLVVEKLINAAKRRVNIFVLVDSYASKKSCIKLIPLLKENDIHFSLFEPPFKSEFFYFSRRMHQKVVVFDTNHAIVGGINIADRYNDSTKGKAWLDFAIHIEGFVVQEIESICKQKWNQYKISDKIENPEKEIWKHFNCMARVRENDWVWHKNEISNTYIDILRHAKKEIIILCSYFIPGRVIRRQMVEAVKRGVKIQLIVAGKSDIPIAKHAERWLYDWLLRNKMEVYEYQNNVLHGKMAICDDYFVTIGSYNINNLSTYVSLELNIDIKNDAFAQTAKETLVLLQKNECTKITKIVHNNRKNIFIQLHRWLCYNIIKAIFKLFTFYYRRKH